MFTLDVKCSMYCALLTLVVGGHALNMSLCYKVHIVIYSALSIFTGRGVVSMANSGPNTNKSQL